jgi:sugar transferase (PEP-CTERM/EpsH1 system associated)
VGSKGISKKVVVHLTHSFGCGGLERVIANLIQYSGDEFRHVIISLTDETSFSYALPKDTEVHTLKKQDGLDIHCHLRLLRKLKSVNADVLHTYNFATLEYHVISKLSGVKVNIHADHGLGEDSEDLGDWKYKLFRKSISLLLDHYIVVSEELKRWAIDTIGVKPSKVKFVFNGVPIPEKGQLKDKGKNKLNLVTIGRLAPIKNQARLLKSLSLVNKLHPEISLHCDIVGDGPEMDELKKLSSLYHLEKNVTFHGHQNDVVPFIKNSDALVLSSDYEAMPMTVLEAMSHCRPAICPDVGGVKDFVSDDDIYLTECSPTGIAEAIIKLAKSSSKEYSLKVYSAYSKVKEAYSVEKMTQVYEGLYR